MKSVLIIGCGDIGQRVARLCLKNHPDLRRKVYGLVRSEMRAKDLEAMGITPVSGDLAVPQSLEGLPTTEATVFYFAPPPSDGDSDPWLGNFLAAVEMDALPEKVVLISTTAVYGDCSGQWITEEHVVNPQTARGRRRLDAEQALRAWCNETGVPFVILRVGGIYGPGRWPLERLKKGLPILREAESPFTNRIHQDDLAQICLVAAQQGESGEIYNVADGQPGTMSGYFKTLARHFALPLPPEVSLEEAKKVMTAGMLSYLKESRRIDNHKLLAGLKIKLIYPNLEAGLADNRES